MVWRIDFSPEAAKEFDRLAKPVQLLIRNYLRRRIASIEDPKTAGKPLRGDMTGIWRYRVEKYRILCKIEESEMIILVIRVGKRDKVYD